MGKGQLQLLPCPPLVDVLALIYPPVSTPLPAQVLKVNGQAVNNLQELVAAVQASKGQYLTFDLDYFQVGDVRTACVVLPLCNA